MRARPIASIVLCAALLAACGASAGSGDRARTQPAAPKAGARPTPPASGPSDPHELPAGVPTRVVGPADPGRADVIRAWSAALRAGDVSAANALWAPPAKVQNGTPVLTLATPKEVALFNASLPCGSVVTSAGGAPRGFTIAKVRLTERRGAACDAVGASARTAILVRAGKIVEWYRLPDDPNAPGLQPPANPVDSTTV